MAEREPQAVEVGVADTVEVRLVEGEREPVPVRLRVRLAVALGVRVTRTEAVLVMLVLGLPVELTVVVTDKEVVAEDVAINEGVWAEPCKIPPSSRRRAGSIPGGC